MPSVGECGMAERAVLEATAGYLNSEKLEAEFFVPALEAAGGIVAERATEFAAILHTGGYNTVQRCARITVDRIMKTFTKAGADIDEMDAEDIEQAVHLRPQVAAYTE